MPGAMAPDCIRATRQAPTRPAKPLFVGAPPRGEASQVRPALIRGGAPLLQTYVLLLTVSDTLRNLFAAQCAEQLRQELH
ncbi:MAG: hypothetical protein E2579_24985 [Pseudomonas sp.]|nr:hypothetical protein [Pseudomonas sp.]